MNGDLAEVVERARDDDLSIDEQHAAFAELVRRFEESAFGWALQYLDNPVEAKDATQDAFITAWLNLRQLRAPAAFGVWLKRLIASQCNRRKRSRPIAQLLSEHGAATNIEYERIERQRLLAAAIAKLSEREYRVVVLFYFLGRTMAEIAGILGVPKGTVGKRLHSARIAIRRQLPRAVRIEVLGLQPSPRFVRKLREGMFDEYVGEYRFAARPDLVVRIVREGSALVSYGGGQRAVLASLDDDTLVATEFDGEGRFQRDRSGHVVRFVYYEFGARLGIATKTTANRRTSPPSNQA